MKVILPILLGFLVVTGIRAQDPPPDTKPGPGPEKMEMMAVWRLTEYLQLSQEQAEKFFPLMRVHREQMQKLNQSRRELGSALTSRIQAGETISEKEYQNFLKQVIDLETQKVNMRHAYIKDLEKVLTIDQRVKLLIFDERFKGELRDRMRMHRGKEYPRERRWNRW